MASEHGQVRALVERAIEAQTEVGIVIAGERRYVTNRQKLADIRAAADALDAERTQATPITQEALREALADYAHRAWSGWMEYMFSKGESGADGSWIMPAWAVERWRRQVATPYAELSEQEKMSDRKEAAEMIAIVATFTGQPTPGEGE